VSGERIAVLGGGAWGTALALAALRAGNEAVVWARDAETVSAIATRGENPRYLPGIALDTGLVATGDILEALADSAIVVLATPAQTYREMADGLEALVRAGTVLVCAAKGIDRETGLLPAEILAEAMPGCPVAAISGPSFAADVARGLPTAVTIGANDGGLAQELCETFSSRSFRCYASSDLIGVELGGALKNVIAVAAGIADGLSLGRNARAALITRGLAEIARLGHALGGRAETFMGLTGLGDLVLTCTGDLSRNRTVGLRLAKGEPLAAILASLGHVSEGVASAQSAARLAAARGIDMPITAAVCRVLFEGEPPLRAVESLLARDPRAEST